MSNIKSKRLERLKNTDLFPDEFIEVYGNDYDELYRKEKEERNNIENKFKSKVFRMLEEGYEIEHIQNIIFTNLSGRICVHNLSDI
ncbi:hypothetical protein U6A24_12745 [Aquimarina gracilis]|uniref:Uncharacterized protein n=1 Tax=Aquimarina gracilis TaxID=874422 RepID=A0ABU5ZWW5_9FLAO|nr:hypothetical protein [Aquimarina gracilis]MEB3346338.1 hypothetical protein [Aquimarina gracilis]